jgi:hypothetical protein
MTTPSLCSDNFGEGPTPYDLPIPFELKEQWKGLATRRHFLSLGGQVLGAAAMASLLGKTAHASEAKAPGIALPPSPHFPATAKRVIYLFMSGGPPQMDLWDYKPELIKQNGKETPLSVLGKDFAPTGMTSGQAGFPVHASPWKFSQHGTCGRHVSELLPYTAKLVDDLAVIKSVRTDAINHEPAILLANTGAMFPGHPCLGSWLSYGLGSMNENLPSFVVLMSTTPQIGNMQVLTSRLWGSGFISSKHAGVMLRSSGSPVLYLDNPKGMSAELRRRMLDGVQEINRRTAESVGDPETHARIAQSEMAFNMQMSVPELSDMSNEPDSTWELYGPEARTPGTFAYNCLMARRLAERGVRMTQVYRRGWDLHAGLAADLPKLCQATDRATYALITDLKRRGMLDDTLIVWGGEFGRTVYTQGGGGNLGRDHHAKCHTMWMAGGGVKGGIEYGRTDDFSYRVEENPVEMRDLNATILHTLGMQFDKLSVRHGGLDERLTGVLPTKVVKELLI